MAFLLFFLGIGSCLTSCISFNFNTESYQACADGWPSGSIGRQGACSHHGGVVWKTRDNRPVLQRNLAVATGVGGPLVLLAGLLLSWKIGLFDTSIPIEGKDAIVPLTIGGQTRRVRVIKLDDSTYRTLLDVALVRCPERKRKSVFKRAIEFRGRKGKFKPQLNVWIHTGRGRAGGYTARAFAWNSDENSSVPK